MGVLRGLVIRLPHAIWVVIGQCGGRLATTKSAATEKPASRHGLVATPHTA